MFSSERDELRKMFFTAWQNYLEKKPLDPLHGQIVEIILQHPEYHSLLNDPEKYQTKDFMGENPFLHMSLHLALRDQIKTDRPAGIKQIYENLFEKFPNALSIEHRMMECLERVLWEAQRNGVMPDESVYLDYLRKI